MRAQMGINGVADRVGFPGLGEIDVSDLPERVYACIGAPGALYVNVLATERRYRLGEDALDRHAVVLHLPADERAAIIFDQELVARHCGRLSRPMRSGSA